MTIAAFIEWVGTHPNYVILYMVIVPALALITSFFVPAGPKGAPSRYLYSILMYATCVPGVLAVILTGYSLILQRDNLLEFNIFVYFLPIISMAVSIAVIQRVICMDDIPGFKKLSGFMLMIAVTFIIVFLLQRMFVGIVFFGTIQSLLILFVILFVVIKIGWERVTG